MSAQEVGQQLVDLFNKGEMGQIYQNLYSNDILSVEADGAEYKGMEAINGKNEWWESNFETHGGSAKGPFPHGNQFAVIYNMDVTERASGNRFNMEEVGVYTVADGRIVEERFFYTS